MYNTNSHYSNCQPSVTSRSALTWENVSEVVQDIPLVSIQENFRNEVENSEVNFLVSTTQGSRRRQMDPAINRKCISYGSSG